jgi:hypothetical protein
MRRLLFVLSVALLIIFGAAFTEITRATDCDSNNVVHCGVSSPSAMGSGFQEAGVADIFSWAGISQTDVNNMASQAVRGTVTKSGDVLVSGKLVATGAMTAGRQNIAGSTRMSIGGTTFFVRPPSVSFLQSSLPAFVMMKNGQFDFAVIAACGNPVIATPVAPKPAPPQKTVVKTPPKVITKTVIVPAPATPAPAQTQTQSQSQTVNVAPAVLPATTPPPAVTTQPVAAVQPAPADTTLPKTGAGNIDALAVTTSTIGAIGHWLFNQRSRRF